MNGFYFKFQKIGQDLQDLLDNLNTLLPATGLWPGGMKPGVLNPLRGKNDYECLCTVSSVSRKKIQFILYILSEKNALN